MAAIVKSASGVVVPIPTSPLFKTLNSGKLFEFATSSAFVASVELPVTARRANGDVVPTPTFPVLMIVNLDVSPKLFPAVPPGAVKKLKFPEDSCK